MESFSKIKQMTYFEKIDYTMHQILLYTQNCFLKHILTFCSSLPPNLPPPSLSRINYFGIFFSYASKAQDS